MEEVWRSALQRALQTPHVAAAHEVSHSHAPQSEAMPRHVMQLHSLYQLVRQETVECITP